MTVARTSALLAVTSLALVLSACGTEDATDPGAGSSDTAVDTDLGTPSIASEVDRDAESLGTVVINQRLDVPPANYPLPDAPTQTEVASVAELAEVYATVPGIDEIVADLEGTSLAAGERLFVYLVSACRTDEVALVVQGDEVPMIVSGTAGLRCPPPTTMVAWVVGDEVPATAKPALAIQK